MYKFKIGDKARFLNNIEGTIIEIDETREESILWVSDSGIKMRFNRLGEMSDYVGVSLLNVEKNDSPDNDHFNLKSNDIP